MSDLTRATIYTAVVCDESPGPGGYGTVLAYKGRRKEISGGFRTTTNNRIHLMAAIVGLEALEEMAQVELFSESRHVVKSITLGQARRWRAQGWRGDSIDSDLWARLLRACESHEVLFRWIGGYGQNPEEQRCHQLATEAAGRPRLPVDEGYMNIPKESQ